MAPLPIPPEIDAEIARLESEDARCRRGALDPEMFRKTRLRLGVYALRGAADRYALRVKVPLGILSPEQLEAAAAAADASGFAAPIHITPRQGFQILGVNGEDVGPALRRLAATGLPVVGTGGTRSATSRPAPGRASIPRRPST